MFLALGSRVSATKSRMVLNPSTDQSKASVATLQNSGSSETTLPSAADRDVLNPSLPRPTSALFSLGPSEALERRDGEAPLSPCFRRERWVPERTFLPRPSENPCSGR